MKKFFIFILVVAVIFVLAKNFVTSGQFQVFLDEHPNETIVPAVEYDWGLLLAVADRNESAIAKYKKVIEKYPKTDYAASAMAAINDALYEMNQNARCFEQGQAFLEKYPKHDKAEVIRRRMQFIQHGY